MSSNPRVPRPFPHLRVFALSLALIVLCLAGLLFGVRLEALAPATGTVTARDPHEVRTPFAGLIELGWYEGEVPLPDGEPLAARLDVQGNGRTDPARGESRSVVHFELTDAAPRPRVPRDRLTFHRLRAGDELWPGQPVAFVKPDDLTFRLDLLESRLRRLEGNGDLAAERDSLRRGALCVPHAGDLWLAALVHASPAQAVRAGDAVATVVPLDPETRLPRDLIARLEIEEKYAGDVAPGQDVRVYSNLYNHRFDGHALARVERVEPCVAASDGRRVVVAVAPVSDAPRPLPLGSGLRAEIVVGRKLVYRVILEH